MTDPDIQTVARDQAAGVLDTLTLAFDRDPTIRYWWPDATGYLHWWPRFAMAMGERGFDAGTVWATPQVEAAAIWLPPGVESDPAQVAALDLPGSPEDDEISSELRAEMARFHPEEPHWYLWLIGVDPRLQGKGLGSALLKHTLRICDERGETAYLESSDPRNVPLYERHGFEALGVIKVRDVPPITPMIRPARR